MLSSKKIFGNRNKIECSAYIRNRQVLVETGTLVFTRVPQKWAGSRPERKLMRCSKFLKTWREKSERPVLIGDKAVNLISRQVLLFAPPVSVPDCVA